MYNQSELVVLSGCFTKYMGRVAESTKVEFFEHEFAQKIFKYALEFYYENAISPSKEGLIEAFSKLDAESKLNLDLLTAKMVPETTINEGFLIEKIKDVKREFQKRSIKELVREVVQDKEADFKTISDKIRTSLFTVETLSDNQFQSEEFTSKQSGDNLITNYLQNKNNKTSDRFFLGINAVDDITGGGAKGKIMLYAAPSSHGKTTALLNHAYNVVVNQKKNVLFVEAEMSMEDIRACVYIIHAYKKFGATTLDSKNFFLGRLKDEEEKILLELATKDFDSNPEYGKFFYLQAAGKTVESVFAHAENLNKIYGIEMIVIDYLVKLYTATPFKTAREIIDAIFRYAEQRALAFGGGKGIFILTAHQINKAGQDELKGGKRHGEIAHTDIKESSEVVNLANTVVGIYDPSLDHRHEFSSTVTESEVIFSFPKNRLGGTPKAVKVHVDKKARVLQECDSPNIENGTICLDKAEEVLSFDDE